MGRPFVIVMAFGEWVAGHTFLHSRVYVLLHSLLHWHSSAQIVPVLNSFYAQYCVGFHGLMGQDQVTLHALWCVKIRLHFVRGQAIQQLQIDVLWQPLLLGLESETRGDYVLPDRLWSLVQVYNHKHYRGWEGPYLLEMERFFAFGELVTWYLAFQMEDVVIHCTRSTSSTTFRGDPYVLLWTHIWMGSLASFGMLRS